MGKFLNLYTVAKRQEYIRFNNGIEKLNTAVNDCFDEVMAELITKQQTHVYTIGEIVDLMCTRKYLGRRKSKDLVSYIVNNILRDNDDFDPFDWPISKYDTYMDTRNKCVCLTGVDDE